MKKALLIACLIQFVQSTIAQTDSTRKEELLVSFSFGESFSNRIQFNETTWEKYASDFSKPKPEDGFSSNYTNSEVSFSFAHISIGKTYSNPFLNRRKIVPSFHVLFGLGGGIHAEEFYYKTSSVRYDTLTSNSTGQEYYLDSTINEGRGRSFNSRQFQIGIGNEYQTNPLKIMSLRIGLSLLYSFSVDQSITFSDFRYSSPNYFGDPNGTSSTSSYSTSYQGRGPRVNAFHVQLPIGVDFRLSRRNLVFKRMYLGLEYRPVLQWIAIEKTVTTSYTSWIGLNLRYRF